METVSILIVSVITLFFSFFITKYTYWKRKNVPGPLPLPILGNFKDYLLLRKNFGEALQQTYQQFPKEPFVGAYYGTEPVLVPRDPEMIKTIMAKEFYYFSGRGLADHDDKEPLTSTNIFTAHEDNWKVLRQSVNPMFSSAKLKNMFYLITDCGKKMDNFLQLKYDQSNVHDVKDLSINYTLEVIGNCVFGSHFGMLSDKENHFRKVAAKLMRVSNIFSIKKYVREIWPTIYYTFFKKAAEFEEGVDTFFFDLAMKSFQARDYKPTGRNDLVDYLLKFKEQGFVEGEGLRNSKGEAKRVKIESSDSMLAGQSMVFFGAGFETSASTLSFTLYELAKHPKIQEKLYSEIIEVLKKHNDEITYEAIQEMKYLDMVESEVLRLYPVLGNITRECLHNYKFEDYNLSIEKGTRVHIPVWAIHYDSKYYPDPEKFDPERFSPEEVQKRHQYTYLAFGEGHRICIGLRFSKLQVAVGLITFVRRFRLELAPGTPRRLSFEPRSFAITAKGGIPLKLIPRS